MEATSIREIGTRRGRRVIPTHAPPSTGNFPRPHLVIDRNPPHPSINFSNRVACLLSPHRDPPAAPGAASVDEAKRAAVSEHPPTGPTLESERE